MVSSNVMQHSNPNVTAIGNGHILVPGPKIREISSQAITGGFRYHGVETIAILSGRDRIALSRAGAVI